MKKNNYWIIGIAIAFFITLVIYVLMKERNYQNQNEKWQEAIEASGQDFKTNLENASGGNTSIQDVLPEIKTVHVNSKEQLK